jgi:hypothetical protein
LKWAIGSATAAWIRWDAGVDQDEDLKLGTMPATAELVHQDAGDRGPISEPMRRSSRAGRRAYLAR